MGKRKRELNGTSAATPAVSLKNVSGNAIKKTKFEGISTEMSTAGPNPDKNSSSALKSRVHSANKAVPDKAEKKKKTSTTTTAATTPVGKAQKPNDNATTTPQSRDTAEPTSNAIPDDGANSTAVNIQIIAGSYERVLHGITASLTLLPSNPSASFSDTFLFNAHASSIRCLALSPPPAPSAPDQAIYLATGGSDEKINLYSLSASPLPSSSKLPPMPSLGKTPLSENPANRELGTLMHHSSHITALSFPSRTKLLSASEDNTICATRTRDLSLLSSIKAPRPKATGQPSGDTAPPGATPAGVNDFAVHPSGKVMVSVGRGERCMRLWNLVTGRKAGVLNFERRVLAGVREGKYSSGEGRRIRWDSTGSEFAVAFERGAVVFGEDSRARCRALPQPLTKVCQMHYVAGVGAKTVLALSTEDGRVCFYDTQASGEPDQDGIPDARLLATLGGRAGGVAGRIKDFEVLPLAPSSSGAPADLVVVTASSTGDVSVFYVLATSLLGTGSKDQSQVGVRVGTYGTGNRITCVKAFVMLPAAAEDEFAGFETEATEAESESSDDSG